MTETATSTLGEASRQLGRGSALRLATAAMHEAVFFVAVLSVATGRFDLWIDLRWMGRTGPTIAMWVWAVAAFLVVACGGPGFGRKWNSGWRNGGLSPRLARLMLWPTYFLIGCLIGDTVYYYQLQARDLVATPLHVPITLLAAVLLGAWVLLTRMWLRRQIGMAATSPVRWRERLLLWVFGLMALVVIGGFSLLHSYSNPPREPVDLAVVLGNRVKADGTASPVLRDRTLAAVNLYKRGLAKHILLSGAIWPGANGQPVKNEPAAMLKVCLDNGVPESAVSVDVYGVNTRATALNSKIFMAQHDMHAVAACSDDYHLYRTKMSFDEVGIKAYTVPSVPQEWQCAEIVPVIREVVGIAVYWKYPNYRAAKEPVMSLQSPSVVVKKSAGVLELYGAAMGGGTPTLIKTYPCITGGNPGDKAVEGDRRTPLGTFHVVFKNPDSKFHLSVGLDYPTVEDAERGLKSGLISREEHDNILAALKSDLSQEANQKKLWYTALGGEIFIHGHAEGRSGTAGCVALSNADIDEIYAQLRVGTVVEIRP